MLYGQPGIGKTTLACSAPSPVLLDYDGGISRVNGAHQCDTVQVSSWEDTQEALKEIAEAGDTYQTVIIDTVGKMLNYMEDYIKRTQPRLKQMDGTLSLKGYGVRKQMFLQLLKDTSVMGKNIIFVAHEREERDGDDKIVRPESGSAANDLVKELDLVGYMQAVGTDRTITFDPQERFYAKNTVDMHGVIKIPVVVDNQGIATGQNNFLARVIERYEDRQKETIKETAKFEAQMQEFADQLKEVQTAEQLNALLEQCRATEWLFNGKTAAAQMINREAAKLNLHYNKTKRSYEQRD